MTEKELQRAHIMRELEAGGVTIVELPGGCIRLYGQHGSKVLITDVLYLRRKEIEQLCS